MEKEKSENVKCGPVDENDIREAVDLLKKYVKIVHDNSLRDVISESVLELDKTEHLKKFANEFRELDENVSVKDLARKLSDLAGKPTMEELKPAIRYLKDLSEKVAGLNLDMADKMSGPEKIGMATVLNKLILDGKLTESDFDGIVLCGFPKDSIQMWKEMYRPANERKKRELSVGSFRRLEQPIVVEENSPTEDVELGSAEKANAILDEIKETSLEKVGCKKTSESGYWVPAPQYIRKRFSELCESFENVQALVNATPTKSTKILSTLRMFLDQLIKLVEENSDYNWGDYVLRYGKWLSDYEQGLSSTIVVPAKFTGKCCACEMNCRCRHKCDKTSYEKCGGVGKILRDGSVVQIPKPVEKCTDCGSPERDMTIPKSSNLNLDRDDRDNMRKFVKKLEPKNELERLCLLFEDKMKDIMKNDILYIFALKQIYQLLVENKNLLHAKLISDIESYLIWTHLLITKKQLSDDVLKTFNQHKSASCFIPGHFRDCDSENKVLALMKSIIDSLEKSIKDKELKTTHEYVAEFTDSDRSKNPVVARNIEKIAKEQRETSPLWQSLEGVSKSPFLTGDLKEAAKTLQKYSKILEDGKPFDAKDDQSDSLKQKQDRIKEYITKTEDEWKNSINNTERILEKKNKPEELSVYEQLVKARQDKSVSELNQSKTFDEVSGNDLEQAAKILQKYAEIVEENISYKGDNFIATPVDVKGTDGPFRRKLPNKIESNVVEKQDRKSKLNELIHSISQAAKNGLIPNSAKEKNKKFHELSCDSKKAEEFGLKLVAEVKKEKIKQKLMFDLSLWQKTKVYFRDLKNKASTLFKSPEITEEEVDRAIQLMEKQIAEIKKSKNPTPEMYAHLFDHLLPGKGGDGCDGRKYPVTVMSELIKKREEKIHNDKVKLNQKTKDLLLEFKKKIEILKSDQDSISDIELIEIETIFYLDASKLLDHIGLNNDCKKFPDLQRYFTSVAVYHHEVSSKNQINIKELKNVYSDFLDKIEWISLKQ